MSKKDERRLWGTACHEAGHAFAQGHYGLKIHSVSIVPGNGFLGRMRDGSKFDGPKLSYSLLSRMERKRWEDSIVVSFSGRLAAKYHAKQPRWSQAHADVEAVKEILHRFRFSDPTRQAAYKYFNLVAEDLVQENVARIKILALAKALMDRKTLTGLEVKEVFRKAMEERIPAIPVDSATERIGSFKG